MGDKPYPWTPEIESEIFTRIAKGESVRSITQDDWLPSETTVYKRLAADAEFAANYARARETQADVIFDEVQQIADLSTPETVQVDRLRVDVRKWRAGKLRPKVYGEKLDVEHSGGVKIEGINMTFVDAPGAKDS